MNLPVILLGGGGHARILIDVLKLRSISIAGIVDPKLREKQEAAYGLPLLGDDEAVKNYPPASVRLVNGLGPASVVMHIMDTISVKTLEKRKKLFEKFKQLGYTFQTVIHPSAIIASNVALGEGVQIMAGAILQPGSTIGANAIVNTGTSVDHDCVIGDHVHLAAGVTLCGGVRVGEAANIGAGATVVQNIQIAPAGFVRAGSIVTQHLSENTKRSVNYAIEP